MNRHAKRVVAAAESNVWGSLDAGDVKTVDEIYRQLCLFDEHTWGHINSVALPWSPEVVGQYNEKARYAYRSLAQARWLSGAADSEPTRRGRGGLLRRQCDQAALERLGDDVEELSPRRIPLGGESDDRRPNAPRIAPWSAPWERPKSAEELTIENTAVTFPDNCPDMAARFWVDGLQGGEIRRLRLSLEPAGSCGDPAEGGLLIETDSQQWPTRAIWPAMEQPLFLSGFGEFLSVGVRGFAPRWIARDVFATENDAERQRLRHEVLEEIPATAAEQAVVERSNPTTVYTQVLRHPRLQWATRRVELWNHESRARLTMRFSRTSSEAPEWFFAEFSLPCEGVLPRTSSGGLPFVPFRDQLPGTCRDYFAVDGWVDYETPKGNWLWVSRDCAAGDFRRSLGIGSPQKRSPEPRTGHGHGFRQPLVHQFRGRQPRGDGIPVRSGLDRPHGRCHSGSGLGRHAASRATGNHRPLLEGRPARSATLVSFLS